jgi:hypothetical protein
VPAVRMYRLSLVPLFVLVHPHALTCDDSADAPR